MKRLVVLISGNGSNLQAILDACASGELPASIVSVISDKADAYGVTRAKNAGVDAIHFPKQANESRRDYDARLAAHVSTHLPDYVILAGWMRILTSSFLNHFPNRVINLHPALPGSFPGTHAIERAFNAYQRGEIDQTGVMVHLVPDEGVDNGPVLGTELVLIHPDETLESLEARIYEVEHKLLVETLQKLIGDSFRTPNLTLDTSCIIPFLHLPDDFTDQSNIAALEKLQKAYSGKKLTLWVSKKSINETLMNLEKSGADESRHQKWIDTFQFLGEYNKTVSVLILGVSKLGYDAVIASDDQANEFERIKQVIIGSKSKLNEGDIYDIAILYEHHLQHNDLFVTLDRKIFRQTIIKELFTKFGIRTVTPVQAVSILESEYKTAFN